MNEEKINILVCSECGSADVQTLMWVTPNKNPPETDMAGGEWEDNWCKTCAEHCYLITKEEFAKNKEDEEDEEL